MAFITLRNDATVKDFLTENCCISALQRRNSIEYEVKWHTGYSDEPSDTIVYEEPRTVEPTMEFDRPVSRSLSLRSARTTGALSSFGTLRRRYTQSTKSRATSVSSTVSRSWTTRSQSTKGKLRISGPTGFRNLTGEFPGDDNVWKDPSSYRTLQLSIHLPSGRLAPLPDFNSDEWTAAQAKAAAARLSIPPQAMMRPENTLATFDVDPQYPLRSNPVSGNTSRFSEFSTMSRASQQDSMFYDLSADDFPMMMSASALPYFDQDMPSVVPMDERLPENPFSGRRSKSFSRPGSSSSARTSETPSSMTRSMSERVRRSGSLRRNRLEDVEEEIRELNTIIEERRQSAMRMGAPKNAGEQQQSNSDLTEFDFNGFVFEDGEVTPRAFTNQHVPAIAPAMRPRVRSETLSDIGSAFSVPMSIDTIQHEPAYPSSTALVSPTSPEPAKLRQSQSASSKLRNWFSRNHDDFSAAAAPRRPQFGTAPSDILSTDTTVSNMTTPSNSPLSTPNMSQFSLALPEFTLETSQKPQHSHSPSNDSLFSSSTTYLPASTYSPSTAITTPLSFSPTERPSSPNTAAIAALEKEMEALSHHRSPGWAPKARRNESVDTNATYISEGSSTESTEVTQIKSGNVMVAVGEVGIAF